MEPVSEEVRHHGSAVRPVQAEPSGVQAWEAQYLRPARREGGTAQVGVITIHSLSECDFEILKRHQAPAHIWGFPR